MLRVILAVSVFVSGVFAHQIVAKPVGKNKYEIAFWTHDGFEKYEPSQLLEVNAYGSNLESIKAGVNYQKDMIVLTEKTPAMITATFDAGYWINTHKGFIRGDKLGANGIIFDAIHSVKLTKSILSWSEEMINPIGEAYEIVPLSNPFALKVGEKLPIMVLRDGKPAGNVLMEIANHDELKVKTNELGIVLIPIKAKGLQLIAARFEKQIFDDPKASRLFVQSSLTFELK